MMRAMNACSNVVESQPLSFTFRRARAVSLSWKHAALISELFSSPIVMRHVGTTSDDGDCEALFQRMLRHTRRPPVTARAHFWALSHARTGEALGIVSLARDAEGSRSGETGVMLLPQAHASGVGLYALDALVDALVQDRWGFGLDRIWGRFQVANGVVRKVAIRLGFEPGADGPDDGCERWVLSPAGWQARAGALSHSTLENEAHV